MKKKLVTIVLAVAMVFTLMPMTCVSVAYADDSIGVITNFTISEGDVLSWDAYTGDLGEWEYVNYDIVVNGFTVMGTGDTTYGNDEESPQFWYLIAHNVYLGRIKKPIDDNYTVKINAVVGDDEEQLIVASSDELIYNFSSPWDNPKLYGRFTYSEDDECNYLDFGWEDDFYESNYYFQIFINDVFHRELSYPHEIYVDSTIDDFISRGLIDKADDDHYSVTIKAYAEMEFQDDILVDEISCDYEYISEATGPKVKFENVSIGSNEYDEVALKWNYVKGADHYLVCINEYTTSSLDSNGLAIDWEIDHAIEQGYLVKASSYNITLEAINDEDNVLDTWSTVYEYDSSAEPFLDHFDKEQVKIDWDEDSGYYGYLVWNGIKGATYYEVEIGNNKISLYGNRKIVDFDFRYYVDSWIEDGLIEKEDEYTTTITAYNDADNALDTYTGSFAYDSAAIPPADSLVDVELQEVSRYSYLIWYKVKGADYYKIIIDGSHSAIVYYEDEDNKFKYNVYNEIDDLIREGDLEYTTEHTVRLEAYKYAEEEDIQVCEPWEKTFSYSPIRKVDITISDEGALSVKYMDGSEVNDFQNGKIEINDNYDYWLDELPVDINAVIDSLIKHNESFEKTDTYNIYLEGTNSTGRTFIYGDYSEYEYDSQAEYTPPVEMTLTKEGKYLKWDPVSGADHYEVWIIQINNSMLKYLEGEENCSFDVEKAIDISISEGYTYEYPYEYRPDTGENYGVYVIAYDAGGYEIGSSSSLMFRYDSETERATSMDVNVASDGTLTWDAIPNADYYLVGTEDELWEIHDTTVNINEIIDDAISYGYTPATRTTHTIFVYAYAEDGIRLKEWRDEEYYYESPAGIHIHNFGPWEPEGDQHKRVCKDDSTHIEYADHVWGSPETTKAPTCEAAGVKTFTCSVCGATRTEAITALGHDYGAWTKLDDTYHQKTCSHDARHIEKEAHKWDAGIITKEATTDAEGVKTYTCTVCGATKTEKIDKLAPETKPEDKPEPKPEPTPTPAPTPESPTDNTTPETTPSHVDNTNTKPVPEPTADPAQQLSPDGTALGEGASAEAAETAITTAKTDKDLKGSVYNKLQLKQSKVTNKAVTVSWSKVSGAKSYVVYAAKSGKNNKLVKVGTTTKSKFNLKKLNNKALGKGTYYKFEVVALDKDGNVVSSSKIAHIATSGKVAASNPTKITTKAKKDKVTLKVKKTFKLQAKAVAGTKNGKIKKVLGMRYESTNTKVATVSSKGVIKGVKKGTCYVYAYAQNGLAKKIKVTVKK